MNRVIRFILGPLVVLLLIFLTTCNSLETIQEDNSEYTIVKLFNLPSEVSESSGLIIYDSLVWTFNDSGNDPVLYAVSVKTQTIIKKINLEDAENIDWEDIAQDDSSIYIGDFGNAMGNRKDLVIYKISKSSIGQEANQLLKVDKIQFAYNDQTDFSGNYHATPYDCEAMVVKDDSLIIFTKDWLGNMTAVYRLPKYTGIYEAERIGVIESDGLITGADFNQETNEFAFIGYNEFIPFIILLNTIHPGLEVVIDKRFSLNSEYGYQMEGITYFNNHLYITSENSISTQALFEFIKN